MNAASIQYYYFYGPFGTDQTIQYAGSQNPSGFGIAPDTVNTGGRAFNPAKFGGAIDKIPV